MEIEVLGVDGVPPETIVSIRAGASRRQAPVSALSGGVPFKFPAGPKGLNPFKVDLFQPLCSARLALKPSAGVYECPIEGSDIKVKFTVNEPGKPGVEVDRSAPPQKLDAIAAEAEKWSKLLPKEDDPNFPATAAAVKDYLDNHQLLVFVKALLQTVIRDQPGDPFQFIAEQFRNAANSVKKGGDASAGLPKEADGDAPAVVSRDLPSFEQEPAPPKIASGGLEDLESAKAGAIEALLAVMESEQPQLQEQPSGLEDLEEAKAGAIEALMAVFQPEQQQEQPLEDLEVAKAEAVEALLAAFHPMGPEESLTDSSSVRALEDIEAAKAGAIEALMIAMASDPQPQTQPPRDTSETDFQNLFGDAIEAAKAKAVEELAASRPGSSGVDGLPDFSPNGPHMAKVKSEAIEALAFAFDIKPPEPASIEDAKAETRKALINLYTSGDSPAEAGGLLVVKQRARDALISVLSGPVDAEPAPTHEDELVKASARDALDAALLAEAEVLMHTDDEELRDRAKDALNAALLAEAEDLHIELTEREFFDAKEEARKALDAALMAEPDFIVTEDDLEGLKDKTREALKLALLHHDGEEEEQYRQESLRTKAKDALSSALFEEAPVEDEEDALRNKAKDALSAALEEASVSESAGEDVHKDALVKASARDALDAALLAEAELLMDEQHEVHDDALRDRAKDALNAALLAEVSELHMEITELNFLDAKEEARKALDAALMAEPDLIVTEDDLEGLKDRTREALQLALLHHDGDEEHAHADHEELLALKFQAKNALRMSLLGGPAAAAPAGNADAMRLNLSTPGQASEVGGMSVSSLEVPRPGNDAKRLSFKESADPAKAAAEEAKLRLLAAKTELMQLNTALRSEVSELSEVYEGLLNERELLKQHVTPS